MRRLVMTWNGRQTSSNWVCRIFGSDARAGTIIDWVELVSDDDTAPLACDGEGMVSARHW